MQNHELIEIEPVKVEAKVDPLKKYFKVQEYKNSWQYTCKVCHRVWSLSKESEHPGNKLFLLNHAHSHKKNTKPQ